MDHGGLGRWRDRICFRKPLRCSWRIVWHAWGGRRVTGSRSTMRPSASARSWPRTCAAPSTPLLVAGYSSIAELVDLISVWQVGRTDQVMRVVLGSEPFTSQRSSFVSPEAAFTQDARAFWLEQGISIRLSGKVIQALEALDAGRLQVRAVSGEWILHAKIYVADDAATLGSSNYSFRGLEAQAEANARFQITDERQRYDETAQVAENYWQVGQPWDEQFRALLAELLQFVTWQEALARACADLLNGEWAARYLPGETERRQLWPSQVTGIAQALWVIDNVGSVLVADATGSGKTRMGAHLTRAVRDRLYQTGRVRRDLAVLVAPPGVQATWKDEAIRCGLSLEVISHGRLSKSQDALEDIAVRGAQILALDESHNFLNKATKRTQKVTGNAADHVLLFTATPISRGAQDLLSLVQLLGPDNFDDATIDTLLELERRPSTQLSPAQYDRLRAEIRRFTVRRTKRILNELVDLNPEAYRDPRRARINRYPEHRSHTYPTGETPGDEEQAAADPRARRRVEGAGQPWAAHPTPRRGRRAHHRCADPGLPARRRPRAGGPPGLRRDEVLQRRPDRARRRHRGRHRARADHPHIQELQHRRHARPDQAAARRRPTRRRPGLPHAGLAGRPGHVAGGVRSRVGELPADR